MPEQHTPESVVYIIDDDVDVREGIAGLLESVNLKSEAFASVKEFLQEERGNDVSCIILDVRLPGLSGLDLQAELNRISVRTPIVFITGHGDIRMSVRAMKGGAVEFLTKPVRDQDLLDAVRVALEQDRERKGQNERMRELRARYASLSEREREVMALVCSGLLNKQIAGELHLSEVTVKVHRHRLMSKLGAKSVPDLVRMAESIQHR